MGLRAGRTIVFLIFSLLIWDLAQVQAQEISGRIQIEPPYPAIKRIKVRKKTQDSCAENQISRSLRVSSTGGVANTVVWLEGDFKTTVPAKTQMTLDQMDCNFEPHVVLIPPGGLLRVCNSDPLAHDVRAFEKAHMLFRLDMDTKAKPELLSFEKPGIHVIRCGLHPWMHAFAVQAAHDFYAVSDNEGNFALKNVPAGTQKLHIWHETLGESVLEIKASPEPVVFTFKNNNRP